MKIFEFLIDNKKKIIMKINPDSKENEDKSPLYFFDWCEVYIFIDDKQYLVFNEYLTEGITSFYNVLNLVLQDDFKILEDHFELGEGYYSNEDLSSDIPLPAKSSIWMTIGKKIYGLWVYNYKREIYLEVSPIYPYHSSEIPTGGETYEDFKQNYKMNYRIKLNKLIVKRWRDEARRIKDSLQL